MKERVLLSQTGIIHVIEDEHEVISQFYPFNLIVELRVDKQKGDLIVALVGSDEASILIRNDIKTALDTYNKASLFIGSKSIEQAQKAIIEFQKKLDEIKKEEQERLDLKKEVDLKKQEQTKENAKANVKGVKSKPNSKK